ncbi:MAG: flagellin [Deltaproteobacteria bacterium]|nr:flagellin [Deltaproteobacteria bacterium]
MSLRINHNTASLNAHRNLNQNDSMVSKSLERLSSGLKINRAGDAPASLVASEQMRSQIASIEQAIRNSEVSVSMVQTAEGALAEVNNMLVTIRQLSIHAANEGANDDVMLAADQLEIDNLLSAIDRISTSTEFGSRKLLDGSNGVSGIAIGGGLQFVKATTKTQDSKDDSYEVTISQLSSQASLSGTAALTEDIIKNGERLSVTEGGKTATYITKETDTASSVVQNFNAVAKKAGLDVMITSDDSDMIQITHNQYGKKHSFKASSSSSGIVSQTAGTFQEAMSGSDLQGKINGEATIGDGDTITGIRGNANTDGLTVRFTGQDDLQVTPEGVSVGRVNVSQNSLTFQVGPGQGQTVNVALQNTSSSQLGTGIRNESKFLSLSDVDVTSAQKSQDTVTLVDTAINEVTKLRADLGSFQKNILEANLANLRIANENMVAAESSIRDTDVALEMAEFTRRDLMLRSASAMVAQANQVPSKVMNLLMD